MSSIRGSQLVVLSIYSAVQINVAVVVVHVHVQVFKDSLSNGMHRECLFLF